MKLYFYTANTSEQYGNLGISVEICEAEEKPKTYRPCQLCFPNYTTSVKKYDIGHLVNDFLILTTPDFEYAKKKFIERAEEKVYIAKETLKRVERELEILRESEE